MSKRKSTWGNMAAYTSDRATTVAGPRHIGATTAPSTYTTMAHSPSTATRTGANDALALPSRMGDQLHYRDGSTELFSATPINPTTPTTPLEPTA